jgi:hypothetical protein
VIAVAGQILDRDFGVREGGAQIGLEFSGGDGHQRISSV